MSLLVLDTLLIKSETEKAEGKSVECEKSIMLSSWLDVNEDED